MTAPAWAAMLSGQGGTGMGSAEDQANILDKVIAAVPFLEQHPFIVLLVVVPALAIVANVLMRQLHKPPTPPPALIGKRPSRDRPARARGGKR